MDKACSFLAHMSFNTEMGYHFFRRHLKLQTTIKRGETGFSETSVVTRMTTRSHNPVTSSECNKTLRYWTEHSMCSVVSATHTTRKDSNCTTVAQQTLRIMSIWRHIADSP